MERNDRPVYELHRLPDARQVGYGQTALSIELAQCSDVFLSPYCCGSTVCGHDTKVLGIDFVRARCPARISSDVPDLTAFHLEDG